MNSLFNQVQSLFAKHWWIEISTDAPRCIYYFGPFKNKAEATQAEAGYVEDLRQEGADPHRISIMKRPTPKQLTVEYPLTVQSASSTKTR